MAAAAHGELELSQLPSPPKIPETSTAHDPDIRSNGQYADAHCDAFSESQKLSEKEQQKLQKHIHTQQSVPVVDAAAASRAQGQKSLVEFWTKGQMKAHFRFAALFFVVVVSLTIFTVVAGEYCDVYQWSLRPPPECAVDPYIVRIKEEGGISRSVNAFCCGVAPELCFNASKTNLTFDMCCTSEDEVKLAAEYPACQLFTGVVVFDILLSLGASAAILVTASMALIVYRRFRMSSPRVQVPFAVIALLTGAFSTFYFVWMPVDAPAFCVGATYLPAWIEGEGMCGEIFEENGQMEFDDDFQYRNARTRLVEALFSAAVASLILLAMGSTLVVAIDVPVVRRRITGLFSAVCVFFVIRVTYIISDNTQFGLLPFLHLFSVAIICGVLQNSPEMQVEFMGSKNAGLAALHAQVVPPETCTDIESIPSIAASIVMFVYDIVIAVSYFRTMTIVRDYLHTQRRSNDSPHLRFTFLKWHMHSYIFVLLLVGAILVAATPMYFDELLEYSYSFASADGTACAFLFQNINQGNFTFGQLGVPSDDDDDAAGDDASNTPFTCGNDFFVTARRVMGMDSGLELLVAANSTAYFEMYGLPFWPYVTGIPEAGVIPTNPDHASVSDLYFCCNMPDFPSRVRYRSFANLGVSTRSPLTCVFLLFLGAMFRGVIRGLTTLDQPSTASLSRVSKFQCLDRIEDIARLQTNSVGSVGTGGFVAALAFTQSAHLISNDMSTRSKMLESTNTRSVDEKSTTTTSDSSIHNQHCSASTTARKDPAVLQLLNTAVVLRPSPTTLVLERQVMLCTLSKLCYSAAALARKHVKSASSDKAKVGPATMAATATFEFQERLHQLLSPESSGMYSRALHYSLEHEVFCWVIEAPTFIAVVWRGTASMKNVMHDLDFSLVPLHEDMEDAFAEFVRVKREEFDERHPELEVQFDIGNKKNAQPPQVKVTMRDSSSIVHHKSSTKFFSSLLSSDSLGDNDTESEVVDRVQEILSAGTLHAKEHKLPSGKSKRRRRHSVVVQKPHSKQQLPGVDWRKLEAAVSEETIGNFSPAAARVHRGFLEAYLHVREAVEKTVRRLHFESKVRLPVFVTGHSMGGALATLSAYDLAMLVQPRNILCSTFASPRVGNDAFKQQFDALGFPAWRFVNNHDPVTRVPASSSGIKFAHVGTMVLLLKQDLIVNPTTLERFGMHSSFFSPLAVERHFITTYLRNLWRECAARQFRPSRALWKGAQVVMRHVLRKAVKKAQKRSGQRQTRNGNKRKGDRNSTEHGVDSSDSSDDSDVQSEAGLSENIAQSIDQVVGSDERILEASAPRQAPPARGSSCCSCCHCGAERSPALKKVNSGHVESHEWEFVGLAAPGGEMNDSAGAALRRRSSDVDAKGRSLARLQRSKLGNLFRRQRQNILRLVRTKRRAESGSADAHHVDDQQQRDEQQTPERNDDVAITILAAS